MPVLFMVACLLALLGGCAGVPLSASGPDPVACIAPSERVASMPHYSGGVDSGHPWGTVTLYRDAYGVPAVFADRIEGAQFGFGFAQAEDHLPEMLFLALQARGRLSSALGAACLESDRRARTLGFDRDAARGLASMDPQVLREVIEPFVAGVNAYAIRSRTVLPGWMLAGLPLTARDVLATANLFGFALSMSGDPHALGTRIALLPWGERPGSSPPTASNAFALRASRTASGRPMLGANPHIHLSMPFLMYEARVKGGALDIRGSTFFGLPVFIFGFTPSTAWGVTLNYADTFDRYLLRTGAAGRYVFDGGSRAFERREERIEVRDSEAQILRLEESLHGPVVERDPAAGTAIALGWATRGDAGFIGQLHRMNLARDRAGFERALGARATPNYSFLFVDSQDELLHAHAGRVAAREAAPTVDGSPLGCGALSVDWVRNEARAAAPCANAATNRTAGVPGWTSATLVREPMPLAAFPVERNPPRGWAQMANTPPWSATRPSSFRPCGADPLIAPCIAAYPYIQNLRGLQFAERLDGSARLSTADATRLLFDARVPAVDYEPDPDDAQGCTDGTPRVSMQGADRCGALPALYAAWARVMPSMASERRARLEPGIALLNAWNGRADRDARAAALFQDYVFALGARTSPEARLDALERAIAFRTARSGRIDPAWGEVHRLVRRPSAVRSGPSLALPVGGSWQFMGTINAFEGRYRPFLEDGSANPAEDGVVESGFGSAQMLLVELGPDGPRAWGAGVFGASEDPSSPHFADQARDLFARDRMRPLPFHESDFFRGSRSVLELR